LPVDHEHASAARASTEDAARETHTEEVPVDRGRRREEHAGARLPRLDRQAAERTEQLARGPAEQDRPPSVTRAARVGLDRAAEGRVEEQLCVVHDEHVREVLRGRRLESQWARVGD
jgi:hypothetical protein